MRRFIRKEILVALSLLLIVVVVGVSCGGPAAAPTPTFTAAAGATPTALPTPTPAPVKPIVMKTASYSTPTYSQRMVFERGMANITKNAGGRIVFDYYPAEQLLKLTETFDGVRTNIIQMAISSAVYERERMGIVYESVTWPFSWDVDKWFKHYRDPGMYYEFAEPYWNKHNLHLLTQPRVPYGVVYSRKQIKTLEDLKGQLLRSTTSFAPVMQALGAVPVFLTLPEIYEAIQRGTVDGAVTTIQDYVQSKRYEVAKYLTVDAPWYSGSLDHVINLDFYKSLSPDLQKIIDNAFIEAEQWWGSICFDDYNKAIEDSKKNGAIVYNMPPAELERIKKAIQPYWDTMAKQYPDVWDRFNKIRVALSP